jgi:hypothetical protein
VPEARVIRAKPDNLYCTAAKIGLPGPLGSIASIPHRREATLAMTRGFNVLAACAAFAFLGAVLLGVF